MAHSQHQEDCGECDRETPHAVSVEIREESPDARNASYSREPYRVATCLDCGAETTQRMNSA